MDTDNLASDPPDILHVLIFKREEKHRRDQLYAERLSCENANQDLA